MKTGRYERTTWHKSRLHRFIKGYIPWNKGKTKKIKNKCLTCGKETFGKYCSHKCRPAWNKGKTYPEITKNKIRLAKLGTVVSEAHKLKISKIAKERGFGKWNSGKRNLKISGEKNWNWQGGISFNPYSIDWTATLRRSIRERDNYTCKMCNKQQSDRAFCVHHIDYNKENSNPNNLITLCNQCHSKTNINKRYWKQLIGTAKKGE